MNLSLIKNKNELQKSTFNELHKTLGDEWTIFLKKDNAVVFEIGNGECIELQCHLYSNEGITWDKKEKICYWLVKLDNGYPLRETSFIGFNKIMDAVIKLKNSSG